MNSFCLPACHVRWPGIGSAIAYFSLAMAMAWLPLSSTAAIRNTLPGTGIATVGVERGSALIREAVQQRTRMKSSPFNRASFRDHRARPSAVISTGLVLAAKDHCAAQSLSSRATRSRQQTRRRGKRATAISAMQQDCDTRPKSRVSYPKAPARPRHSLPMRRGTSKGRAGTATPLIEELP
jgi:hypothetical protein